MTVRTIKIKNPSKPVFVTKNDVDDLMEALRNGNGVQMTSKDGKLEVRFFEYAVEEEHEPTPRKS